MSRSWTIRVFSIAFVIVIVLAGFGNAVLHLWNNVIPAVFGLPAISYWQAVGLLSLSWIFFGSWRAFPRFPRAPHHHGSIGLDAETKDAVRKELDTEHAP